MKNVKIIRFDEKEKFYFPNKHLQELENEKELNEAINPTKWQIIKAEDDRPI